MKITNSEYLVLAHVDALISNVGDNLNTEAIIYSRIEVRQQEISCILILLLKLEYLKNYKGCRGKHEDDLNSKEKEYYSKKYKDILDEWYAQYPEYKLNLNLDTYHGFDSELKIVTRENEFDWRIENLRINTPIDENVPTYVVYRHIELRDLIVKHLGHSLFDSIVGETFYNNAMNVEIESYMLIHVSNFSKFKKLYVLKSKNSEVITVLANSHCLDMVNEWYASKSALVKELGDSLAKTIESLQEDLKELKGCTDELKTEIGN